MAQSEKQVLWVYDSESVWGSTREAVEQALGISCKRVRYVGQAIEEINSKNYSGVCIADLLISTKGCLPEYLSEKLFDGGLYIIKHALSRGLPVIAICVPRILTEKGQFEWAKELGATVLHMPIGSRDLTEKFKTVFQL